MKREIKSLCMPLCVVGLLTSCASSDVKKPLQEADVAPVPGCMTTHIPSSALPFPTRKNSIGMEFIEIPAGTFAMGSHETEKARHDEVPKHCVTISRSFYLGKYEVTQAQWDAVMDNNPSLYKDPAHPVENVSWEEAQVFIQRLNKKENTQKYRLPTEAEWEYAARAGTTSLFSFGENKQAIAHSCLQHAKKAEFVTCPAGDKKPNPWGLYDMHGNVWEWVQDWYDPDYYATSPKNDPRGPETGKLHVLRGGGWHSTLSLIRSAVRGNRPPDYRDNRSGFRLVFNAR
ncbi:MAG: formylglycine-generating enzyme family protein [Zoogloeaceae bacterium]|jgi:formylglycine-generating enzyme required for sulfatase activity|nr:formylglycine-generating enzyme family protein [Zoogloeaceae bacterium]